MRITLRPTMSGDVFDHSFNTCQMQAVEARATQRRRALGVSRKSAVANDVMGIGLRHIEHRRTGHGNTHRGELEAQCLIVTLHPLDSAHHIRRLSERCG